MARKVINGAAFINVALGSASTTPEHKPGDTVVCDSGLYVYGSANGAIDEGAICKFVEGTWDFDEITTAESGSTNTPIGVCVASGGLADNYWGWFWRGQGKESVYVQDIATDTQVTTTTSAGEGGSGGDNIDSLFTNENNASAGLTVCRASRLLSTNFTTAAT